MRLRNGTVQTRARRSQHESVILSHFGCGVDCLQAQRKCCIVARFESVGHTPNICFYFKHILSNSSGHALIVPCVSLVFLSLMVEKQYANQRNSVQQGTQTEISREGGGLHISSRHWVPNDEVFKTSGSKHMSSLELQKDVLLRGYWKKLRRVIVPTSRDQTSNTAGNQMLSRVKKKKPKSIVSEQPAHYSETLCYIQGW